MKYKTLIIGLFALLLLPSMVSAILSDGLISYHTLDNADGVTDVHGSIDGTNYGATSGITGVLGEGYDFSNGANPDDYISFGQNHYPTNQPFTYSLWVKLDILGDYEIMHLGDAATATGGIVDFGSFNTYSNTPHFRIHDGTSWTTYKDSGEASMVVGNWYHLVATRDASNLVKFYVNGVLEASGTNSGTVNPTGQNFLIGARHNSGAGGDGDVGIDGKLDEFGVWDRALTSTEVTELYNSGAGCAYSGCITSAAAPDPYAHVKVLDSFDNTTLNGLTVYLGDLTNTTDGSGIAYFYNTTYTNYTVDGGSNYFNTSGTATQNATTNVYAYGAFVALEAYDLFGTQITTFNVSSGAYSNTTSTGTAYLLLSPDTSHNVVFSAENYLNKTESITTSGKDTSTYNTSGLYQTVINLTGTDLTDNSTISNFTLNYTGGLNGSTSTTTGNVTLYGLYDNYTFIFDAAGYSYGYYNLTAASAAESHDFGVYRSNSINFTFFDEETGALLDNTMVYLEMISTAQSGNYSTTTGSIYEDLLSPDAYTLRYNALGYEDSFYEFNLVDRSFNALNLTLLNTSSSTDVTLTVFDTLGNKLEDATIKVLKYDITSNTYPITEIITTNFEGVAIANIVLNSEYYKFIIDYDEETRLTTTPTYIYGTSLTFYIPVGTSGMEDFFDEAEISGTLTFNYGTNWATFIYSDLDNIATEGCLYAYTSSLGVNTLVNSSCSSSSSGTLNIPVFNSSSNWYLEGVVTKGETHTISTYNVNFAQKLNESGSGAFFAFILLAVIVFIGLFSLEIAVLLAAAVPLLFTITGLADFDYVISIPILLLGLVTAFVIGSNKK